MELLEGAACRAEWPPFFESRCLVKYGGTKLIVKMPPEDFLAKGVCCDDGLTLILDTTPVGAGVHVRLTDHMISFHSDSVPFVSKIRLVFIYQSRSPLPNMSVDKNLYYYFCPPHQCLLKYLYFPLELSTILLILHPLYILNLLYNPLPVGSHLIQRLQLPLLHLPRSLRNNPQRF